MRVNYVSIQKHIYLIYNLEQKHKPVEAAQPNTHPNCYRYYQQVCISTISDAQR